MSAQKKKLLTILGCSGSAALMLSLGHPMNAMAADVQNHPVDLNPMVEADRNPILDALGCGCVTCQMTQISAQ